MEMLKALKRFLYYFPFTRAQRRHALVGPPRLWKIKREFQFAFLKSFGLQSQHYLLDIGCGTLRGGIPIIAYLQKGHYFGIEARREVLEEGRKELDEAKLTWKEPTLIVADNIKQVSLAQKFDYIWAFSVLIHMSNEVLNDALGFVSKHLSGSGVFYANVNIGKKENVGKWQGFPLVYRSINFYNEICSRNGLAVFEMGTLKKFGHKTNTPQDNQRMLKITKL